MPVRFVVAVAFVSVDRGAPLLLVVPFLGESFDATVTQSVPGTVQIGGVDGGK